MEPQEIGEDFNEYFTSVFTMEKNMEVGKLRDVSKRYPGAYQRYEIGHARGLKCINLDKSLEPD